MLLKSIPSLSYRVSCFEQDNPNPSSVLDWMESDGQYKYLFRQFDKDRRESLALHVSFDGKTAMTAADNGKVIYIKECKDKPLPNLFKAYQALLAAYDFVLNDGVDVRWKEPGLEGLKKPGIWEGLAQRLSYLPDEQIAEKRCKVLEVAGGKDKYTGDPLKYKVYIDVTSGCPIGWKTYDDHGTIQSEFSIVKQHVLKLVGMENAFAFPEEVEVKYFVKNLEDGKLVVTNWQRFKFENVAIADTSEIPLDVSEAEQICDLDKNVVIQVPR